MNEQTPADELTRLAEEIQAAKQIDFDTAAAEAGRILRGGIRPLTGGGF